AKELRKNMTPAEKKLWYQYLRNFEYRVLRQRPINHFIVDFYCPHLKLVIELDGDSHFNEVARAYDLQRSQTLAGYGLQVIRFTNKQVFSQFEAVCASIAAVTAPVK
ncbi:MAG: endonuclease domain-containing protein, partial [Cyanobacteria bacterium P01_D01_bin.71]